MTHDVIAVNHRTDGLMALKRHCRLNASIFNGFKRFQQSFKSCSGTPLWNCTLELFFLEKIFICGVFRSSNHFPIAANFGQFQHFFKAPKGTGLPVKVFTVSIV
jgi:hypothetical protein